MSCALAWLPFVLSSNRMTSVLTRLSYRINAALERHLPEQRLFLKSDTETRFIRLRPATQAIALMGGTFLLAWTLVATAVMLMDSIGAGSGREQALMQQGLYEQRLNALSADRDLRVDEAARAQERFNLALDQVSDMQARLLASEDSRRESETGIDVIQNTLRRTIDERDQARADAGRATLALAQQGGTTNTEVGRVRDTIATLEFLTNALGATAKDRDAQQVAADAAHEDVVQMQIAQRGVELRNDAIFAKLEEAVTVSMDPLDKMFRDAGLSPDDLLKQVRKGYSGQGGPLSPLTLSTSGPAPSVEEIRANAILTGLDRMNMYRIAAFKAPFSLPVKTTFRYTSGFGGRDDPLGRGYRMHEGQDLAGDYGSPIIATADGTVTYAGWENGYGRLIKIQHDFGIETRYGHLSQIRVEVGQRVSRGDRIGDMGNSGRSTGTHLHYEIRFGSKAVNPMTFIKAARDVF
jgi:murein DD-endopeptidase MepM/ murein hydrolase activator NlpD